MALFGKCMLNIYIIDSQLKRIIAQLNMASINFSQIQINSNMHFYLIKSNKSRINIYYMNFPVSTPKILH